MATKELGRPPPRANAIDRDSDGTIDLEDRKSTCLNSSHLGSSYAVFCLKKKRRLAHAAVDLAADYLAGIGAAPVFQPMRPAERATLMQEPLDAAGLARETGLERFRPAVLPHAMGNGHPRFFGWVNSPPAPIGIVADFLAAALNPSCAGGDHASIYVERAAVRWLMVPFASPFR